jgi:hypothetical protein
LKRLLCQDRLGWTFMQWTIDIKLPGELFQIEYLGYTLMPMYLSCPLLNYSTFLYRKSMPTLCPYARRKHYRCPRPPLPGTTNLCDDSPKILLLEPRSPENLYSSTSCNTNEPLKPAHPTSPAPASSSHFSPSPSAADHTHAQASVEPQTPSSRPPAVSAPQPSSSCLPC